MSADSQSDRDVYISYLHNLARNHASTLREPDKKQLRFNEIVQIAMEFYNDPASGVIELVNACDRAQADLYVPKHPMWQVLRDQYQWMRLPSF